MRKPQSLEERKERSKIDNAIAIQEQIIVKLKEYKATLINLAVTGKIKVPMPMQTTTQAVA